MARIQGGGVRVDGIVELHRALKAIDPALEKELKKSNKSIAQFVAADAKSAATALGGVAAHVAPSIKANAGSGWAGISLGGPGFEMAGGAEFGAYQYRQFQPWRGNSSDAGYFMYPAIRQDADRIETEYKAAADAAIRKAGLA